jgi:hypothetical protein
MVSEEYFKKLEVKYLKYHPNEVSKRMGLAREIANHTNNERVITKIINCLGKGDIYSVEDVIEADINEIAKIRNMGHESLNIIRTIKGLPTLTYAQAHPCINYYRVFFYNRECDSNWHKDFSTLRELSNYFNNEECDGTVINYICKLADNKEDK